jgi:alpha-ribazole phosphatase
MNIYFLRHGQTEQNLRKTYYGKNDCRLTQDGIKQMKRARKCINNINFDKVFVSERIRAKESAKLVLDKSIYELATVDNRINEIDFGDFECKTYDEIQKLYPKEVEIWDNDWKGFTPPNGENYISLYKRVKSFIQDLKDMEEYNDNILVITHGGVIRAMYCYILNENLDFYWKFNSKNADISIIKCEYGNLFIDSIIHI